MTPTQYVKTLKTYINEDINKMPDKVFNELNKAYQTFTPSQWTFCTMAIFGPVAEDKAIKKQKRKGTH